MSYNKIFMGFCLLAIVFQASALRAQEPSEALLSALWFSEEEGTYVRFEKETQKTFLARIVKVLEKNYENGKPMLDKKNPDKTLRNRSVEGLVFIKEIVYQEEKWITPWLYHPRLGIVAKAELMLQKDGSLLIRGRKFGVTQTNRFVRVDE